MPLIEKRLLICEHPCVDKNVYSSSSTNDVIGDVTFTGLLNVLNQLSDLATFSEKLFTDLVEYSNGLNGRILRVSEKLEEVANIVVSFDGNINPRSSIIAVDDLVRLRPLLQTTDVGNLLNENMPNFLKERYDNFATKSPSFSAFDNFNFDHKMYSNPKLFLGYWLKGQQLKLKRLEIEKIQSKVENSKHQQTHGELISFKNSNFQRTKLIVWREKTELNGSSQNRKEQSKRSLSGWKSMTRSRSVLRIKEDDEFEIDLSVKRIVSRVDVFDRFNTDSERKTVTEIIIPTLIITSPEMVEISSESITDIVYDSDDSLNNESTNSIKYDLPPIVVFSYSSKMTNGVYVSPTPLLKSRIPSSSKKIIPKQTIRTESFGYSEAYNHDGDNQVLSNNPLKKNFPNSFIKLSPSEDSSLRGKATQQIHRISLNKIPSKYDIVLPNDNQIEKIYRTESRKDVNSNNNSNSNNNQLNNYDNNLSSFHSLDQELAIKVIDDVDENYDDDDNNNKEWNKNKNNLNSSKKDLLSVKSFHAYSSYSKPMVDESKTNGGLISSNPSFLTPIISPNENINISNDNLDDSFVPVDVSYLINMENNELDMSNSYRFSIRKSIDRDSLLRSSQSLSLKFNVRSSELKNRKEVASLLSAVDPKGGVHNNIDSKHFNSVFSKRNSGRMKNEMNFNKNGTLENSRNSEVPNTEIHNEQITDRIVQRQELLRTIYVDNVVENKKKNTSSQSSASSVVTAVLERLKFLETEDFVDEDPN
eukprot:gene12850-17224_t